MLLCSFAFAALVTGMDLFVAHQFIFFLDAMWGLDGGQEMLFKII
ncbi:hypothetical protein [Agarivorans sp. QJM3NY_25]